MGISREPIIKVRGLKNSFGEQIVHEGLDLEVRKGEIWMSEGLLSMEEVSRHLVVRFILAVEHVLLDLLRGDRRRLGADRAADHDVAADRMDPGSGRHEPLCRALTCRRSGG